MQTTQTSTSFRLRNKLVSRAGARLVAVGLSLLAALLAPGTMAAQLTLSWIDASGTETGFKIERALACGTFTQIATVGANVRTYVDTGLAASTQYCYRLRAYNSAGNSPYSATASATTPAASIAPTITTQPVAKTVAAGSSVSFSVTATGTAPLTYQWRKNGTSIAGATGATYSLSNVQTTQAGTYSVVVANTAGSVTSANAALTVTVVALAPTITTQPVAKTVAAGSSVSFSVTATGTAPLTYQWRKSGTSIAGATGATYSLSNVQTTQAGTYSVVVANTAGSVTSANAALTVTAPPLVAPSGLAAIPGNAQVTLSWKAAAGATSYNVKRATVSGGPYTTVATGVTATGYTNTGLVNGTVYYFVVSAFIGGKESPQSAAVSATPGILPSPWQTRDIGTVGVTGVATVSGSTYTVKGAGADIGGTTDAFRFLYQIGTGNCDIRARVVTVPTGHSWAKAGVMIRESLNADARETLVALTPANGVAFQRRTGTAGSTAITSAAGLKAPYWVRVVRGGDTLVAMRSTDGTTWNIIGSAMIKMGTSVYIGLAVTSHVSGTLGTATFDNLQVTP